MIYCCQDLKNLITSNRDLLVIDNKYGWLLKWTELTEEPGYVQAHRYAIEIKFCPFCGERFVNDC